MIRNFPLRSLILGFALVMAAFGVASAAGAEPPEPLPSEPFPTPLDAYGDESGMSLTQVLMHRVQVAPFNLFATALFLVAILHTFAAGYFRKLAEKYHHEHEHRMKERNARAEREGRPVREDVVSFKAEIFHFLGEVEAIFGLWVMPLAAGIVVTQGLDVAKHYLSHVVHYTEPMFVVVIMSMAATRPVMRVAEKLMARVAALGGGTPAAWWLSILTLGPLLGSFITEPAAMTISALLLASRFYDLEPSSKLKYGTIGLLFVNISVGGTLTHFAAPPVLMVAGKWNWGIAFMLEHYGWKTIIGIFVCTALYFLLFRSELKAMASAKPAQPKKKAEEDEIESPWAQHDWPVPAWITGVHLFFMAWTVYFARYPVLFIGGFLFFMAFVETTFHHQDSIRLKPALLVGFFLAGLVVHGGLQAWWIAPVLSSLTELPLMIGATVLTAFNDNAAITYLASLVPDFSDEMKYAVVAGAVTGGGLTVIANAPNPAGQSILQNYFEGGVSPLKLACAAIIPTIIMGVAYMALPF
ncbi:MAG: putative Na+/H+ antiporter [Opitutaceae bacterium]